MTDPPVPISRLFAGTFSAIEEKLLSRFPGKFPCTGEWEQVLLVPSNELREHLLRQLAARWAEWRMLAVLIPALSVTADVV